MSVRPLYLKTPAEYSSGVGKLPLGKVDPRIGRVLVNSGKGMALRDGTWTKTCANPTQGRTIDLKIKANGVTDQSGNSNHPTLTDVTLVDGEMQLNGTTSRAMIPRNANHETASFSVRIKLKLDSLTVSSNIVNKMNNGGWFVYIDSWAENYSVSFMFMDSSWGLIGITGDWGHILQTGVFYDYVFTFQKHRADGGGEIKIYRDGVLANTAQVNGTVILNAGNTFLFSDGAYGTNSTGSISAYQTFDYALSPAEVLALTDKRTALYPSQDSLAFASTQTSVKDLQWFIRNPTSEIEVAPAILIEDGTGWTVNYGEGTIRRGVANVVAA